MASRAGAAKKLLVLSASRRTDLVACYPEIMVKRLQEFSPEAVHSVVIWTKNPENMIKDGLLKETLKNYQQIYIHLTITGMGGSEFEPLIPPWKKVGQMIEPLIKIVGSPQRICWRFDPILIVKGEGKSYSNFDLFPEIMESIIPLGVRTCRLSWVSPYKKVVNRLAGRGWYLVPQTLTEQKEQAKKIADWAKNNGMEIYFCAMEGFPVSRCIDGYLLREIHPQKLDCSLEKDQGQRPLCGCTDSLDIGWYSLKCKHGCLYCYACP